MNEDLRETKCYSIGHSDLPIDVFIYFIKKLKIRCIVDVRSTPYSRHQPQFNRENIILSLKKEDIGYKYLGKEVGGRYKDSDLLFSDGTVNYQKVSETPKFQKGIDEIVSLIKSERNISLMCSEKDPLNCHRFVLISRYLVKRGVDVLHICPEIVVKTNKELEQRMFGEIISESQTRITNLAPNNIDDIYEQQNKKIGFKATKEQIRSQISSSNKINLNSEGSKELQIKFNKELGQDIKNNEKLTHNEHEKNLETLANESENSKYEDRNEKKYAQTKLF